MIDLIVGARPNFMKMSAVIRAHVEGGIRSGDWTMPEEINRLVTDAVTN